MANTHASIAPDAHIQHPNALVEKLVYGGDGLARLQEGEATGKIVFVPFSAPGDMCAVSLLPGKQKPARGRIAHIQTPGSGRVTPVCSVFGACGGCHWQHLDGDTQRQWKQAIVKESLVRIGKFPQDIDVLPLPASDVGSLHYRNKIRWMVQDGRLGYYQADSHTLVAFDHCHIMPAEWNALAHWLQESQESVESTEQADILDLAILSSITVRTNTQGQWLMVLQTESSNRLKLSPRWIERLRQQFPRLSALLIMGDSLDAQQPELVFGEPFLLEDFQERVYQVGWESFFQVNVPVAEQMMRLMRQWLAPLGQVECLVDLYAGVGTFAISLADLALQVVAVEANSSAVRDGEANLARNQVLHGSWLAGQTENVLDKLPKSVTVSVLDPPRSGCHPHVLNWVAENTTRQILYTSCDPTTLARDLRYLADRGWQIQTVQPFDMFPQTYHVETLVQLVKP